MKLKEFNKTNTQTFRVGKCQVSVNGQTGVICFTRDALRALKIDDYSHVKFLHDEESGDWYVMPTKALDGFELHKKKDSCYCNNVVVAKSINNGISKKSASYLVSQNPEKHGGYNIYLIIKSSAIVRDAPPPSSES